MKTKTKRGNTAVIAIIVVIVAITFAVIGYLFAKKSQAPVVQPVATQQVVTQPVATQPAPVTQAQPVALTIAQPTTGPVSEIVNALNAYPQTKSMHFNGDTKIDITAFNPTNTAAKGKWWAGDAWDWIAWKGNDGNWIVFADFEGAAANKECNFLKTVPAEQKTFFHDVVDSAVINSCLSSN